MNDKLNEFLAVEVMGWCIEDDDAYFDSDGIFQEPVYMFQPDKNIEQAMMCLERFDNFCIEHYFEDYYAQVVTPDAIPHRAEATTIPIAISLACARAKGWKDE